MATRPVRYETHIRQLVRLIDRENMAWAFDLWDYDQVRANADAILLRTNVDMPPPPYGGPWPAEWVALFQRWKDEGFLRLDLGAVDANGYKATRVGDSVTVTGRGTVPTTEYRAWLDATVAEGQRCAYVHYWEPPVPAVPAAPTLFRVKAVFSAPITVTDITIVDANGSQVVPITAAVTPTVVVAAPLSELQGVLQGLGATHVATTPMMDGTHSRFARVLRISMCFLTDLCRHRGSLRTTQQNRQRDKDSRPDEAKLTRCRRRMPAVRKSGTL